MRVAIYFEDGVTQIALTPEADFEKTALAALQQHTGQLSVKKGGFYPCQGGWYRHQDYPTDATMLILEKPINKPEEA